MTFIRQLRLLFIRILQFVDRLLSRFDSVARDRNANQTTPQTRDEYLFELERERFDIYTELNRRNIRILSFDRANYTQLAKTLIYKFQSDLMLDSTHNQRMIELMEDLNNVFIPATPTPNDIAEDKRDSFLMERILDMDTTLEDKTRRIRDQMARVRTQERDKSGL